MLPTTLKFRDIFEFSRNLMAFNLRLNEFSHLVDYLLDRWKYLLSNISNLNYIGKTSDSIKHVPTWSIFHTCKIITQAIQQFY